MKKFIALFLLIPAMAAAQPVPPSSMEQLLAAQISLEIALAKQLDSARAQIQMLQKQIIETSKKPPDKKP